jgi:hypothetical protein
MIPFASWSFATTRDILPSGSGVAEGRYRTKVAPEAGRYAPEETDVKFIVEGKKRYWLHPAVAGRSVATSFGRMELRLACLAIQDVRWTCSALS